MVDERWIAKDRFVTLVLDGDSHQLLYLGQGRRGETLRRFLHNLPPQIKQQIEAVAMDGSRAYRCAVESELPGARICLDRFHLCRDLMHMLRLAHEEINDSEHGKLQRHVLRRIAMLSSRDDRQAQNLLAELTSAHNINAQVIALVELFKAAWQQPTFHQAAALALLSGIKAAQRFKYLVPYEPQCFIKRYQNSGY